MKTTIKIILYFIFFISLNSCFSPEEYNSIDEKIRIEYYDNDIFIYEGENGNIDTLQVWEIDNYYSPYSYDGGQVNQTYAEYITVIINKINKPQIPEYLQIIQFYKFETENTHQYVPSNYVTNPIFIWERRDKQGLISYKYNNETFTLIKHISNN